jgi:hypothetical protein
MMMTQRYPHIPMTAVVLFPIASFFRLGTGLAGVSVVQI